MDSVRRTMNLSQHVFKVTDSQKYFAAGHTVTLIRLDNCQTFITVHSKEIIQPSTKHRVISVTRIKDKGVHKNLLQLAGNFHVTCKSFISDEAFNDINSCQNYWFGRNSANRLMLYEYPKELFSFEGEKEQRGNDLEQSEIDRFLLENCLRTLKLDDN